MDLIGLDFGNDSCVVSVWRNGRIEIVTNESDFRYTPTMVGFDDHRRLFGVTAKNQWTTNANRTLIDFKRALDQNKLKKWRFDMVAFTKNPKNSTISFDVMMRFEEFSFTPSQVLAMLFIKIKAEAQAFMKTNERILGCVISVPAHFNDEERKAVLLAAAYARLDCRFLIKETTAVAINYSTYKKFCKPINVIFIDFGQSSIQMSVCKFFRRRLEMIEEVADLVGGRDIDEKIAEYILRAYTIDGQNMNDKTFCAQLLYEVEQLKKKMSSSDDQFELGTFKQSITGNPILMCREEMETVCAALLVRIEDLMRHFLLRSKLKTDEIHSIELVGGSSHMPIIHRMVVKVFDIVPIATMNRNEAVARGCLLKSFLNPKRRCYKIVDIPFIDDVDNSCELCGRNGFVRVSQVHKHLEWDPKYSFPITEKEFISFGEMERKLTKFDISGEKRQIARDALDKYLLEHMKPGGVLEKCNAKIKKELNDTWAFTYGEQSNYVDLLYEWTQKVQSLESNRRHMPWRVEEETEKDVDCAEIDAAKKIFNIVSRFHNSQVTPVTYGQSTDNRGTTSNAFVKRITFNDCDEVKLIESKQSCSSEYGSQHRREGVHNNSRCHRLKRNPRNRNRNPPRNRNENQSLIYQQSGQRKKVNPWCCFL